MPADNARRSETASPASTAELDQWFDRAEDEWEIVEQRVLQDGELVTLDQAVDGEMRYAPILQGRYLQGSGMISRGEERVEMLEVWALDRESGGIWMWLFSDAAGFAYGLAKPVGDDRLEMEFDGVDANGSGYVGWGELRMESANRAVWSWARPAVEPSLRFETVFERRKE